MTKLSFIFLLFAVLIFSYSCTKKTDNSSSTTTKGWSNFPKGSSYFTLSAVDDVTVRRHVDTTVKVVFRLTSMSESYIGIAPIGNPKGVSFSPASEQFSSTPSDSSFDFHINMDTIGIFPIRFEGESFPWASYQIPVFNIIVVP